ncbi:zinc finger domain-containing protein [Streptomyces flavidovirens]
MSRHSQAPMPAELRHMMRAGQHPARAHPCPHCGAHPHQPCHLRTNGKHVQPHPQRMATWAQTTACCPTCQVEPTIPCHRDGRTLPGGTVHDERYTEAERTAA